MVPTEMREARDYLSRRWLKGDGVEIGAGDVPLAIDPAKAKVRYVDYAATDELQAVYSAMPGWRAPDVIDDGATLSKFNDGSLAFVASCHFLEHVEDPIAALAAQLSKLRSQGLLFVAIPDMRFCFDKGRPLTTMDHFLADHTDGGAASRMAHLREFARFSQGKEEWEVESAVQSLIDRDYRIHWHTWDQNSFLRFLHMLQDRSMAFAIEHYSRNVTELIAILRKP